MMSYALAKTVKKPANVLQDLFNQHHVILSHINLYQECILPRQIFLSLFISIIIGNEGDLQTKAASVCFC